MHLHGRKFWAIGSGSGPFLWDTVEDAIAANNPNVTFNFDNPPWRDGYDVAPNGWLVIRFKAEHAEPSLLHCHVSWVKFGQKICKA